MSLLTPKLVACGNLTASATPVALYAPSGNSYVKFISFFNTGSISRTVSLFVTSASINYFLRADTITSSGSVQLNFSIGLDGTNSDKIAAKQDLGTDVQYVISALTAG